MLLHIWQRLEIDTFAFDGSGIAAAALAGCISQLAMHLSRLTLLLRNCSGEGGL